MKTIYSIEFNGRIIETTVTNKASEADIWVQNTPKLSGNTIIVGMDCKFIRHPIACMSNKVAILQLCFGTRCLVLQLLHMDYIPRSVAVFLSDSRTTFVGVDIHENSTKLMREYGMGVKKKVDMHFLAKRWFPVSYKGRPTMRALAVGIVGFSKRRANNGTVVKGNWESRVVDVELIEQASVDAYASYAMAQELLRNSHSI